MNTMLTVLAVTATAAALVVGYRAGRAYRSRRRAGAARFEAVLAVAERAPWPIGFLTSHELRLFSMVGAGLLRRRHIAADAVAVEYASQVRPLLITFTALSAIEIPVLDALLPWMTARLILLVVGVYGLLWAVGMLLSVWVRPHTVSPTELRIRFAIHLDIPVPTHLVAAVRTDLCGRHQKTVETQDGTLAVALSGTTNVVVDLVGPHQVHLGRGRWVAVRRVRFCASDPRAAVSAIRAAQAAAQVSRRDGDLAAS